MKAADVPGQGKSADSSKEMSKEELIEEMKAKGMTEEEMAEWLEGAK